MAATAASTHQSCDTGTLAMTTSSSQRRSTWCKASQCQVKTSLSRSNRSRRTRHVPYPNNLLFPHPYSKSSSALEQLYVLPYKSHHRKTERYLASFIDDNSRLACVVPVQLISIVNLGSFISFMKSELGTEVSRILALLQRQSHQPISGIVTWLWRFHMLKSFCYDTLMDAWLI